MLDHGGEDLIIADIFTEQATVGRRCALVADEGFEWLADLIGSERNRSGDQPAIKYSTTTGSSPEARIMASVFRDVPQFGLW